jgi:glycogen synthase
MARMLRILVISNLYPPQVVGGYERAMADYARLLSLRGHTVQVLTANVEGLATSYANSEYADHAENFEIKRSLSLRGTWTSNGVQRFSDQQVAAIVRTNHIVTAQEIRAFNPDICLVGNIDLLGIEIISQILGTGIPVAHYLMNKLPGYPFQYAPKTPLYCCITVSDWVRRNIAEAGYPTENTQTIYPGGDAEKFYQSSLPPRDRLRIVYASLVMPYKGADLLIDALGFLQAAGVEFTATIAGGSLVASYVQSLQETIKAKGLQASVQFTGLLTQAELQEIYRTHNVWVLPSRFQEPFSIGLLEAMQAGLTIIASNTGGSPEAIDHGETGFIFESEHVLDLAKILTSLPINPDLWASVSLKGQQKALSRFTRSHTIEQLESVFTDLVLLKER